MNPRVLLVLTIAVLLLLPMAMSTSQCPASDPNIGPYSKVEVVPAEGPAKSAKLINEEFIVKATYREEGAKVATVLSNQPVKIYYLGKDRSQKTLLDSGNTDSQGEYRYAPKELGWYRVECVGRAPEFEVKMKYDDPTLWGAVCGNGICEEDKYETREDCPEDCTECGDGVCEGLEDKDNCPDDCIICGDGECDAAEFWPTGCSCVEDCLHEICGDGVCDPVHGENDTNCPSDCFEEEVITTSEGDDNTIYLLIIAIIAIALVASLFRERIMERFSGGDEEEEEDEEDKAYVRKAEKKKGPRVEEDGEVLDIIIELMDAGMSENRIKGKLEEFGVGPSEIERLMKKAKKMR